MSKITENWCNFILSEGIMPSIIVRKLRKNAFDDIKLCTVIAEILINHNNINYHNTHITTDDEVVKKIFNADIELTNWLESMQDLLDIIKSYANKDKMFSKIVDEACLSFINSCNLVSDKRKQIYINAKTDFYSTYQINTDIKQAFREYLENQQYSYNTINSYISGINKVGKLNNIRCNLWEITNADEMNNLINLWEHNKHQLYNEYKQQDLLSRKTLSNAVKRYAEFLEYQTK